MKTTLLALVLGALSLPTVLLSGEQAQAQGRVPEGSYRRTCWNIRIDRGTLFATCQDRRGRLHETYLQQYWLCRGDIENDNGMLRCADHRPGDRAPEGSYRRTCWNIRTDRGTLFATCQDRRGRHHETYLQQYWLCRGDIENDDGRLRCVERRPDDRPDDRAPEGSYRSTCRDIRTDRGTLYAECMDRGGRFRATHLEDYRMCRGDIENDDGRLRCAERRPDDRPDDRAPEGSYRSTCRDIRTDRGTLFATCQDRRGRLHETYLQQYWSCRGDIENDDGRLRCADPQPNR
ncbi:CVNH domain-containing protein [Sorangium sp. So ce1036]|uniref:CVNH domain-containing protein n=1 Tax=Sorangium sp. So ce1036 TaxID=3133328 RepID=UPI003F0E4E94